MTPKQKSNARFTAELVMSNPDVWGAGGFYEASSPVESNPQGACMCSIGMLVEVLNPDGRIVPVAREALGGDFAAVLIANDNASTPEEAAANIWALT